MKITKTIKGWEPFKYSKKDLKAWFYEFMPKYCKYNLYEAKHILREYGDPKKYKTPKKCTLTITYEVED